jgi:hypothetical protein
MHGNVLGKETYLLHYAHSARDNNHLIENTKRSLDLARTAQQKALHLSKSRVAVFAASVEK